VSAPRRQARPRARLEEPHRVVAEGADAAVVTGLADAYEDIRLGLGYCKTPDVYGAFPVDAYSHTPAGKGARQPGMTGQVKEEILTRQKELGVVPADTQLTARHEEIPAWDDMPDELKPILARQMEVYAGFLEHTDHHVGRLVDALDDLGVPKSSMRAAMNSAVSSAAAPLKMNVSLKLPLTMPSALAPLSPRM